ncbi:MAG: hypothetical protein ABDH28_06475, partial [Brevinematia bacterium]
MHPLEISLISVTYGVTAFIFLHSLVSNYLYSMLMKEFRRLSFITVSASFISSTFNFVSFFLGSIIYLQVVELLSIATVLAFIVLAGISFKSTYNISVV